MCSGSVVHAGGVRRNFFQISSFIKYYGELLLDTLLDGSLENLKLAVHGLNKSNISDYVIIGGWCPYLNRNDKFHPGTIDVDILFKESYKPYYLKNYIQTMREEGYFTSAKHQFQLLKVFDIQNNKFCFNIDLLHTGIDEQSNELFVDQLDLNVILSNEEIQTIKMKSIVQKESKIIFENNLYETISITDDFHVKIINYTGLFITKLVSCQKEKRDRDSYDIYLGFENEKIDFKCLKEIYLNNAVICNQINIFKKFLESSDTANIFNERVKQFRNDIIVEPATYILKFLSELS